MKKNVGSYDAAARFVLGGGLLALANHGCQWGWMGLLPIVSGGICFCPVWWAIGCDTTKTDRGRRLFSASRNYEDRARDEFCGEPGGED